jgi:site-specific recombinase XerC
MENLQRFEQPPTAVNVTVAKRRPREYLTEREIERLMKAAEDARAIQHYLGHRSIASTVRYTALAPDRFSNFWKD